MTSDLLMILFTFPIGNPLLGNSMQGIYVFSSGNSEKRYAASVKKMLTSM